MSRDLQITREPLSQAADYGSVPIAFTVTSVFDVADLAVEASTLRERKLSVPYVKDYDLEPGEGPSSWPARFDVENWASFAARLDGRRIGGAVVAWNTPGVDMLEGRSDLAVLWDIRVSPQARGKGGGAALFRAAESWAREVGCREMKVETQNVNVPACRFYARMGCALQSVDRNAYPELPDEVQLIWAKQLSG